MHFVGSSGFALCEWLGGLPVVVNDVNPVGSPMAAKLVHCLQAQHGQSFQNQAAAAQAGCRVASAAAPLPGDLLREISHLRKECSALRRQLRHAGRVAEQAPEVRITHSRPPPLPPTRMLSSTSTKNMECREPLKPIAAA